MKNTLLSDIIKRNTKLQNLQPLVFRFETSVAVVAFKDANGDKRLAARKRDRSEPLLMNVPISLVAADGSVAASGVTDSTGKYVLRAQLDLGDNTLKSSLNPSVAIRVTLTKGGAVSGFSVPINPQEMSTAKEVFDAGQHLRH